MVNKITYNCRSTIIFYIWILQVLILISSLPTLWAIINHSNHISIKHREPKLIAHSLILSSQLPSSTISKTDRFDTNIDPTKLNMSRGESDDTKQNVAIGFIGCGTIASAIATGLATQKSNPNISISSIAVTQRSKKKSDILLQTFPDLVTVYDESGNGNQNILNNSDIVFLCVLPQQVDDVLEELTFDENTHTLVSLVSTTTVKDLVKKSGLPKEKVFKMICLPAVSFHEGVCLLTPPTSKSLSTLDVKSSSTLLSLFQSLGGCVECETEANLKAMMVPGCLMGPLYGILQNNLEWLVKQGVPAKDASYFLGKQYLCMIKDAERKCEDPNHFNDLIEEQTPGGLNEQALNNLKNLGGYDAYDKVMDAILSRLNGESDGYIH